MTQKQLIDQFCEFKGKCTTDDVVALNFAYEMLAPRWISVEEKRPKLTRRIDFDGENIPASEELLVFVEDNVCHQTWTTKAYVIPSHSGDRLLWVCSDFETIADKDQEIFIECLQAFRVTHWMPLPQAPTCSEKPNKCEKGGEE